MTHSPEKIYQENVTRLTDELQQWNRRKNWLAWARLLSFLSAFIAAWLLWPIGLALVIPVFIALIAVFVFFITKDLSNNDAIRNTTQLIAINKQELQVLAHSFTHLPDGIQLKPAEHPYANDLDIFGRASLYQYLNRTTSEQGQQVFANWLLRSAGTVSIQQRQEAAKELAQQTNWRQQLRVFGLEKQVTQKTATNIAGWLKEENRFINAAHWKVLRIVLPLISFTVLGLHLGGIIPAGPFYSLMLLFLAGSFAITKLIWPAYTRLNRITSELDVLSQSIRWIETATFKSPLLVELQKSYEGTPPPASQRIRQLKKILDRLDYRLNPLVFVPLSIFLYWDLQQIFSLEKWKANNQQAIGKWYAALAEIEALSTLGNLCFNHPDWVFPGLSSANGVLIGEEIGHPLIPADKRVNSSFSTQGSGQIALITGSNMAGKSTFLRSAGINIVLAMMGAPVCAKKFTVSSMQVMSSMRISDNLEESTSTFYAELKKLQEIIVAVNKKEKVFLLLDEILRGTNSADRHTGSKALIRQLIHHDATGMIATHDLELAKLSNDFPGQIHNYHFDVQVANGELYFDYKLKVGVCQSMNASILMKKIGIEL